MTSWGQDWLVRDCLALLRRWRIVMPDSFTGCGPNENANVSNLLIQNTFTHMAPDLHVLLV